MRRVLINGLVIGVILELSLFLWLADVVHRIDGGVPTPHSAMDQFLHNTPRARSITNVLVTTCLDLSLYMPFQLVLILGVARLWHRGHRATVAVVVAGTFLALFSLLAVDHYFMRLPFGNLDEAVPYIHCLTAVMCTLSLVPVALSLRASQEPMH
jgi:hypothetical protein